MNQELTTVEKMRGVPWSLAGNATNSVFVELTFFGPVFVLFLSELGLSKTQLGSLLALIPFFGLMALFVAPAAERLGYKRTFIIFYGARKVITAGLLLTPWVLAKWGSGVVLLFVIGIVAAFAACRAISLTARFPWAQEFVPNAIRGKYTAGSQVLNGMAGFLAVTGAGYFLGASPDLDRFVLLFAVGTLVGLVSVWSNARVPGGAPTSKVDTGRSTSRNMLEAVGDPNLLKYLVGAGLVTLASTGLASLVPLFMRDEVGLASGNVVLLQSATLVGGLLTSYLWGWAADRYGSKPVMLSGVFLKALLPLFWFVMPREGPSILYVALGIACLQGFANMSWSIGAARLLYVSVVPPKKKTGYMAVYFAWLSIISMLSHLMGGRLVDYSAGISGQFLVFTLDAFSILFLAGVILPLLGTLLLRGVRDDTSVSVTEFAGMFLHGNPFRAMEAVFAFQLAKDEPSAVSVTERLGRARSPLIIDELLESLSDPRFNVRFEAIVSIAHGDPAPRLREALAEILRGPEPALSVIAAWALGRMGDHEAIEPLRAGLDSSYRSVRAHCARSLATLGDGGAVALLLERMAAETDKGLQIAYAAALGKLQVETTTGQLLDLLHDCPYQTERKELALALARIVGGEHYFIRLLRHRPEEAGTAFAQALLDMNKELERSQAQGGELAAALNDCAETLAREDVEEGATLLARVIRLLPTDRYPAPIREILHACAGQMEASGARRIEYLILALHTLEATVSK
jgi:MFS family permease